MTPDTTPASGSASGKPRYLRVADRLIEEILAGTYPVGTLLPTEARLCRQYDVSRITAREALRHVQSLGLIARRQGVGSRVIADTLERRYGQSWASIEDIMQYARSTRLVPARMEAVEADAALAQRLSCQPGQRFLKIEGCRLVDDAVAMPSPRPICWTEIHIVDTYAGVRNHLEGHHGAIASLIEDHYGERICDIAQEIRPAALSDRVAGMLDARAGDLALQIDRRYSGHDGRVFEISRSLHPADRFSYAMRLTRAT